MTILTARSVIGLIGAGLVLAGCVTTETDTNNGPPPTFDDLYDAGIAMYNRLDLLPDTLSGQIPSPTTGDTTYNGYFSAVSGSTEFAGKMSIKAKFSNDTITGSFSNMASSSGVNDPDVYYPGTVPLTGNINRVAPMSFNQITGTYAGNVSLNGTSGTFDGSLGADFKGTNASGIIGEFNANLNVGSVNETLSGEIVLER